MFVTYGLQPAYFKFEDLRFENLVFNKKVDIDNKTSADWISNVLYPSDMFGIAYPAMLSVHEVCSKPI